jgi:hypothetical protein
VGKGIKWKIVGGTNILLKLVMGKNLEEDEDKDLFRYNEHSIKEWYEKVLPLFESRRTIKGVASVK